MASKPGDATNTAPLTAPVAPEAPPQVSPQLTQPADQAPSLEKQVEQLSLSAEENNATQQDHANLIPTADNQPDSKHPTTTSTTLRWPETGPEHPLTKLYASLPSLIAKSGHNEVYGIKLGSENEFHTKLILQKFLRANVNDVSKASEQLLDTLVWRKKFDPVGAAEASYPRELYEGLGWIIEIEGVSESMAESGKESLNRRDVVTFNVYGAVRDNKKTFGDLDTFMRWRVGLMERGIQKLNLQNATTPIPDFGQGPDPYQGYQVHDYLQTSFLFQDKESKAAAKTIIHTLARHYPETMSRKYFVNVPRIMSWMYNVMKRFVATATAKKFQMMAYGAELAAELGPNLPSEYGGKGALLKDMGEQLKLEEWGGERLSPAQEFSRRGGE